MTHEHAPHPTPRAHLAMLKYQASMTNLIGTQGKTEEEKAEKSRNTKHNGGDAPASVFLPASARDCEISNLDFRRAQVDVWIFIRSVKRYQGDREKERKRKRKRGHKAAHKKETNKERKRHKPALRPHRPPREKRRAMRGGKSRAHAQQWRRGKAEKEKKRRRTSTIAR